MPNKATAAVQQRVAGWEQADVVQLIVFRIGREAFGIPIDDVREIIRAGIITPIPDSPPFVKGLINVRGDIIPTIDLSVCFSLMQQGDTFNQHVVVTRNQASVFGLLVDEVTDVLRITEQEISEPPKILSSIQGEYVAGVVTVEDQLTIVLDLEKLLSEDELRKLNESTRRRSAEPGTPGTRKKNKKTSKKHKNDSDRKSSDKPA